MVNLFQSRRFCDKFLKLAGDNAIPGTDPQVLLAAFKNYYSFKNPHFGANHWYFTRTKITLKTDSRGIRFETDDPSVLPKASALTLELAQAIGKERWLKTFLSRFPAT
jgi:hypothetical protein